MESLTVSSNPSQEYPVISTDFPLASLNFDLLAPLSTFESQADTQGPLPLLDHTALDIITSIATTKTNAIQMLHLRQSSFELCTKPNQAPVSLSSESSDSSSVSLCTPSYLSSVPSASLEDWITEVASDLDILAPTGPDLSFSFTPLSSQKPPAPSIPTLTTRHDEVHQQTPLAGQAERDMSLSANPTLVRTSNADSGARPVNCNPKKSPLANASVNTSPRISRPTSGDSPLLNGASSNTGTTKFNTNKKNYAFLLPYNNGNRSRNSSYLESQLDCLAQHQAPLHNSALNSNDDIVINSSVHLDMLVQSQDKQGQVEEEKASKRFSKNSHSLNFTPRKEVKRLKGRLLGLINHSSSSSVDESSNNSCDFQDYGRRQSRLSTCSLADRANNFIFSSIRTAGRDQELEDDAINPKAWSDPTHSNHNTGSSSGSRVKPSRSLFNLFLN